MRNKSIKTGAQALNDMLAKSGVTVVAPLLPMDTPAEDAAALDVPFSDADPALIPGFEESVSDIVNAEAQTERTVYQWEVPSDRPGYTLRIEVEGAESEGAARFAALEYRVPVGDDGDRKLSEIEQNWIQTTSPSCVRDTRSVTLAHGDALTENERLRKSRAAYDTAKSLLALHGIDIDSPSEGVNRLFDELRSLKEATKSQNEVERRALVDGLVGVQSALAQVIENTGFAPPKPIVPAEPDYSAITVIVSDLAEAQQYPRLKDANFVARDLAAPLSDTEKAGITLLTNVVSEYWRTKASETEQQQVDAAMNLFTLKVGE